MRKLLAVLLCFFATVASGKDNVEIGGGAVTPQRQQDFRSISEDLVATIDYKAVVPAEATGIVGFGAGVIGSYVPVDDKGAWQRLTGSNVDALGLIGIGVTKGLPFGLDVGAFYTEIPNTDVSLYGAELRYALLEGGVASPALALRGSYVKVDGIDTFDLDSKSVDLLLSKGFALITPYVGVGRVYGESDPQGAAATAGFTKEKINETKAFIGARISLGLIEFTPELGQIGDNTTYNLRVGFSFSL